MKRLSLEGSMICLVICTFFMIKLLKATGIGDITLTEEIKIISIYLAEYFFIFLTIISIITQKKGSFSGVKKPHEEGFINGAIFGLVYGLLMLLAFGLTIGLVCGLIASSIVMIFCLIMGHKDEFKTQIEEVP